MRWEEPKSKTQGVEVSELTNIAMKTEVEKHHWTQDFVKQIAISDIYTEESTPEGVMAWEDVCDVYKTEAGKGKIGFEGL